MKSISIPVSSPLPRALTFFSKLPRAYLLSCERASVEISVLRSAENRLCLSSSFRATALSDQPATPVHSFASRSTLIFERGAKKKTKRPAPSRTSRFLRLEISRMRPRQTRKSIRRATRQRSILSLIDFTLGKESQINPAIAFHVYSQDRTATTAPSWPWTITRWVGASARPRSAVTW